MWQKFYNIYNFSFASKIKKKALFAIVFIFLYTVYFLPCSRFALKNLFVHFLCNVCTVKCFLYYINSFLVGFLFESIFYNFL